MSNAIYLIPLAAVLALIFAFVRSSWISRQDAGTPEMKIIAGHIREGAMAFLTREYRVLAIFVVVVSVLLAWANAGEAAAISAALARRCRIMKQPPFSGTLTQISPAAK